MLLWHTRFVVLVSAGRVTVVSAVEFAVDKGVVVVASIVVVDASVQLVVAGSVVGSPETATLACPCEGPPPLSAIAAVGIVTTIAIAAITAAARR